MTDGILTRPFRAATIGIVGLISLVAFEAIAVATALPTAVRALNGLAWYGWSFTAAARSPRSWRWSWPAS